MRLVLSAIALSIFAFLGAAAQTPAPAPVASSPQALQILRQSLGALSPNVAVQDVTLLASVRYIAGSDDETGTATLKATALGDARIDLTLHSGNRSEVYNLTGASPAGQWSGVDGASHPIPFHNLLNEPAWFSPLTAIARRLAGGGFVASYVAAEALDSQSVHHISITQPPQDSVSPAALFTHLSQLDLYIDATTLLPAAMSFTIHSDNNALLDVPILVRFSDYRSAAGANFPFHIQKFLNNTLFLDLQLNSANLNTGLSSSTFGLN